MRAIITTIVISLLIAYGYRKYAELVGPLPMPHVDTDIHWGSSGAAGEDRKLVNSLPTDTEIRRFLVNRSEEEISGLKSLLGRQFRLTEPLEGTNFEYGMNSRVLQQVVEYWRDDYLPRWSERQAYLNQFPQYTVQIQGLRIHYIHARPSAEAAQKRRVVPLLLLHGWPGSVREFYDFIPLLNQPSEDSEYVFEVVAPSLVGFGWSEAAAKPGFNGLHMAGVMRNLMLRLGHQRFLVQGGDWGAIIGSLIATLFPANVHGYHSNMCALVTPLAVIKLTVASFVSENFLASRHFPRHHLPLRELLNFVLQESGYFHIQATKPDTIGATLSGNPVGLAAYILEKFQTSAGPQLMHTANALAELFTLDALLDNLMIYHLSNAHTSAMRLYAEDISALLQMERVPSPAPMGCARFQYDIPPATDWALRDKFPNLVHSTYHNQGGHFAALQVPNALYSDFAEFVGKLKL